MKVVVYRLWVLNQKTEMQAPFKKKCTKHLRFRLVNVKQHGHGWVPETAAQKKCNGKRLFCPGAIWGASSRLEHNDFPCRRPITAFSTQNASQIFNQKYETIPHVTFDAITLSTISINGATLGQPGAEVEYKMTIRGWQLQKAGGRVGKGSRP